MTNRPHRCKNNAWKESQWNGKRAAVDPVACGGGGFCSVWLVFSGEWSTVIHWKRLGGLLPIKSLGNWSYFGAQPVGLKHHFPAGMKACVPADSP